MEYIERVLTNLKAKNTDQPEFIQAVEEVLESLEPVIKAHPEYEDMAILERLTEPERTLMFKVPWMDDQGKVQVNRGYRIQFSSAIGPYKGGLSKSDAEVMRFCQSFMTELYRHIGPSVDVPAGDIGVGGREIGYLFGQYKRIKDAYENGVLTGKGMTYGGSLIRPEATGFGAVYYGKEVLAHFNDTYEGKTIAVSGYGNVAWGVCIKAKEYGAKVVSISGRDGYVYDPDGINTDEKIDFLLKIRSSNDVKLKDYAEKFGCEFHPGEKPWGLKVDMAFPCATQNEIGEEEAKQLIANGCKYIIEGANMPSTPEAIAYFTANGGTLGPAKAANAGGVAVSALEMSQNSMRYNWTSEEVDEKLHNIMKSIFNNSVAAAEKYGLGFDLIKGANIAGFEKVVEAMISQGIY